jgi:hypothetical protein
MNDEITRLTARVEELEAVVERVYQSSNQRHIIEMTHEYVAAAWPGRCAYCGQPRDVHSK